MANLKNILEEGLMLHKRMGKLFPEGASLNEGKPKHIKLKVTLIESLEVYDNHEVVITIKSNEELSFLINARAVIVAMQDLVSECSPCDQLSDTAHIIAVIDDEPVFDEDRKNADIRFQVVNNIER